MKLARVLTLGVLVWLTVGSRCAWAAVSPVGIFVGPLSENWESFPVFLYAPLPSPTGIMGGAASISSPSGAMTLFTHGYFGLGTSGPALPSDGLEAVGLNDGSVFGHPYPTATITWSSPIRSFGGYFGATTASGTPTTLAVQFFDQAGTLIDSVAFNYLRPGDGVLEWHGWTSSAPIRTISITGDFLALDGLQASVTSVPEPAFSLLLVLFATLLVVRKSQLTLAGARRAGSFSCPQ